MSGDPVELSSRHTGAGHLPDELSSSGDSDEGKGNSDKETVASDSASYGFSDEFSELQTQITQDLQANINHHLVKVPHTANPFKLQQIYHLFRQTLEGLQQTDFIPSHLGLTSDEWSKYIYPTHVDLTLGQRSKKVIVYLPFEIWFPQSIFWGQAFHIMNILMHQLDK